MGPPGEKTSAIRPRLPQGDWSLGKASQAPLLEEVKPCALGTEQALETHCPATGTHPGPSQLQRASSACLPAPPHSSPPRDPSLKISGGPLEYLCEPDIWQHIPIPAGDLAAGSTVLRLVKRRRSEHAAALKSRCHGKEPAMPSLSFPLRTMGVVTFSTFTGLVGGFHKSAEVKFPTWRE